MKQKDIAMLVVVVFLSGVASVLFSNFFLSSPSKRKVMVEVVDQINPEFQQPDPRYFNKNAIDPTRIIKIGDTPNTTPFNTSP